MRIAIDTGGTFTDCLFVRGTKLEIVKVASTPRDPALAIARALEQAGVKNAEYSALELLHGTTVGTNALLTRRVARVALVTTEGFEDVLVIARQARENLYDLDMTRLPPLVPAARRLGVAERIGPGGEVLRELSSEAIALLVEKVKKLRPEAVAVSLLFSFANPDHEKRIAAALRSEGFIVSVSHEILPEFREYERTATVAVNAVLSPLMGRYLGRIGRVKNAGGAGGAGESNIGRVQVMQSNGGSVSARIAASQPVRTVLSGPAGGIVGARHVAKQAGCERIITFDMGGTSTDISLLGNVQAGGAVAALPATREGSVGGIPIAVPMLDIHTVGAGGGSIAWFDDGGALRAGPHSAGADPGPVCYGKGTDPTVTDAHLVLGRLDPDGFLGGDWKLDAARARKRLSEVARQRGFKTVEAFAGGIIAVANATMERAIRVTSVERGHDPRDFTLVAFGGAGALHACDLAASLRMPRVLVPRFPGGLSAAGILRSDVIKDYSQSLLLAAGSPGIGKRMETVFRALEKRANSDLRDEGFAPKKRKLERRLDLRYAGQGFEITVVATRSFLKAFRQFHIAHEQRYGYADPARAVEVVGVRVRAIGVTDKPPLGRAGKGTGGAGSALTKRSPVWFDGRMRSTAFYDRDRLPPGSRVRGPAIINEYSATTVVPPGWRMHVDAHGNLVLTLSRAGGMS